MSAEKHKVTTDVRHPYYDMCGYLSILRDAVTADPIMDRDNTLKGRLASIEAEIDRLTAHLNANYLWD